MSYMYLHEDKVMIPCERYEQLLNAEATLEALCRLLEEMQPYGYNSLKAVAGDYMTKEGKTDELKY